jgi:hypothetical protein
MNFMDTSGGSYNIVSGVVLSDVAVAAINAASIKAQLNSVLLTRDLAFLKEFYWQYCRSVEDPTLDMWWRANGEYYYIKYTSAVIVQGNTGPIRLSYDVGNYRYYRGELFETLDGWSCYKIAKRIL